ncbi:hypothetical protein AVEN_175101-1 [Araneus ventricosus]|uniref:DDE Tnp4 domain-containing protein n=1 Tax=Araneus ventricosus TaxID=182803 RepID=A0A4Y2PPA4_ARAVE|nr:hypothetical protein AVEN_175101-1 [Araneus ventricosus]
MPIFIVIIFSRYLATGCSLAELHFTFRVGKSTASQIVREVTGEIWSVLSEKEIPPLNPDLFLEIAQGFQDSTDFPHCIVVLDGKHIRLVQPENSGSLFYNYKKKFSIVLLAMCDADYKFTYIDVGSYGKSSNSGIFKNSALYDQLSKGSLDIPAASPLEGGKLFPYVILADQGFAMSENLIRPYGGKGLSDEKIFSITESPGQGGALNVHLG